MKVKVNMIYNVGSRFRRQAGPKKLFTPKRIRTLDLKGLPQRPRPLPLEPTAWGIYPLHLLAQKPSFVLRNPTIKIHPLGMHKLFFFLISNSNLLKSAKGRIPYTREVYKRALKRVEQKVNLKSLQK
jgi:hypothetical protein